MTGLEKPFHFIVDTSDSITVPQTISRRKKGGGSVVVILLPSYKGNEVSVSTITSSIISTFQLV